jgi:hypothetical protein
MPRRPAALAALLAAVLALALTLAGTPAPPAAAQDPGPDAPADDGTDGRGGTETTVDVPLPEDGIIPRPNSGAEPTEAGDRGGGLQVLLLVLIVAGVTTVALLARRDMRRARGDRGDADRDRRGVREDAGPRAG